MSTTDIHLRFIHSAHGMKFNPLEGFTQWKVKVESLFEVYGFTDILEEEVIVQSSSSRVSFGPTPTPTKPSKKNSNNNNNNNSNSNSSSSTSTVEQDNKRKSHTAFTFLLLCLQPEQMRLIQHINKGDAHGVWHVLLEHYERKTLVCRLNLRRSFSNIRMLPDESIDSYISRFKQMVLKLNDDGEVLTATTTLATFIYGLPDEYDQIVDTIGMNQNITFEEACSFIKDKQDKMKLKKSAIGALYYVGDNSNKNYNSKNSNHGNLQNISANSNNHSQNIDVNENNNNNSKNMQTNYNNNNNSNKRCYTCKQEGHAAYTCILNKDKVKCTTCHYVGGHTAETCKYLLNPSFKSNTNKSDTGAAYCAIDAGAAHYAAHASQAAVDPYHDYDEYIL
jgi:hypothetical protein